MVFELFNEPFHHKGKVTWKCLRDGCVLPNACADCEWRVPGCPAKNCPLMNKPNGTYEAVGLQQIVDTIRKTGARQPLLASGLRYTNDLSKWLEFRPRDPLHQLGAAFHFYSDERYENPESCDRFECWNERLSRIALEAPVVATEFGQFDCAHERMDEFQEFADWRGISYLAFGWYVADNPPCGDGAPAMITDYYDATPTPEGIGFRDHLADLHAEGELP